MREHTEAAAETPRRKPQRKSDGQDGPPVSVPEPLFLIPRPANTPGAPNAALSEPPPTPGEGVDRQHPKAALLQVLDADAGLIGTADGSPRRKKIAICGFASSTRKYIHAAAADATWEIRGLNQLYRHIPRADVWYDIHYNWDKEVVPGTDHRAWARQCGIPFYTIARQPDLPTNVKYPLDKVLKAFEADYFTSTIPYMVAHAIMDIDEVVRPLFQAFIRKTPKRRLEQMDLPEILRRFYGQYTIGIFGIDLVVGGEYFHEKPCAEFWIGAAALGRGIKMAVPPESALCKQLYRYGTDPEPTATLKLSDVEKHQAAITAERDEQLKRLYMLEGAIQADGRMVELMQLRMRGASVE